MGGLDGATDISSSGIDGRTGRTLHLIVTALLTLEYKEATRGDLFHHLHTLTGKGAVISHLDKKPSSLEGGGEPVKGDGQTHF